MLDPYPAIGVGLGGGGRISGGPVSKKIFVGPSGTSLVLKIMGGVGLLGPLPWISTGFLFVIRKAIFLYALVLCQFYSIREKKGYC